MLGKEFGHGIPTSRMQYNRDYKEKDQEYQCFSYLERTVLDNIENISHYERFEIENRSQQYLQKTNNTLGFL